MSIANVVRTLTPPTTTPTTLSIPRSSYRSAISATPLLRRLTYSASLCTRAGYELANREFYVFLVRLTMSPEVIPPKGPKGRPILDSIHCSAVPTNLTLMPKPSKRASSLATGVSSRNGSAEVKPWRAVYCKLHTRIGRASSSQKYLKIQATPSVTLRPVELVWLSAPY
jgi:hypothetical protein